MGISQSMYSGVTGLQSMASSMGVISNNIANSNSKGFKYDRAEFEDLLSVDLGGGDQMGRGTRLAQVRTVFGQGGLAMTDNLTDLAIQGQGFFMVKNMATEVQESNGIFLTRVGSFTFDKNGFLSDANGGHIMGYMADGNGAISTRLSEVRIMTNNIAPSGTKKVEFNVNLDSRVNILEEPFDITKATATSNFSNTVNIFDSQGRSHQLTVFFRKEQFDETGSTWAWHATVDGKEVVSGGDTEYFEFARGKVQFDNLGNLRAEETEMSDVSFVGGALPNQAIEFDFGKNMEAEGGNGVGASTSVAALSSTVFHAQDGFESGNLKSMKIDMDGTLRGIFTNGIQRNLGAIALATFENQDGLQKAGRNQFIATIESGPPKVGMAQTGTRGSVYASSLEESNVDLADQFVNMIMSQRAFQANSRSVTTTDTMIEEIINLKR